MVLICRILVVLCLLATITSTLRVYPHQLAYFNEAAGGPENGWKHLLHSNLDWGQDFQLLSNWIEIHHKQRSLTHVYSYGMLAKRNGYSEKQLNDIKTVPQSIVAVSSNRLLRPDWSWPPHCTPRHICSAGFSIHIYSLE